MGLVLGRKPEHETLTCVFSFVFCTSSVSADRSVMAASKFLARAAACAILLSFAAESRESYWSGCDSDFSVDFLRVNIHQNGDFSLWRGEVLELQFLAPLRAVLVCFAIQCL